MTGHGFTSAFAEQLDAYVDFKAAMGIGGTSRTWYLHKFDAHCVEHDRTVFDRETVEGWVSSRLATCGRYRSWMSYIRDFGRFMPKLLRVLRWFGGLTCGIGLFDILNVVKILVCRTW